MKVHTRPGAMKAILMVVVWALLGLTPDEVLADWRRRQASRKFYHHFGYKC